MKALHGLTTVVERICVLMTIAMVLIVFVQVIARYLFRHSLTWSEELARYILVWITFLGSTLALRHGTHIGVDILFQVIPTKFHKILMTLNCILIGLFLTVLLAKGAALAITTMSQPSPALKVPIGLVYSVVPISASIMLLFLIYEILKRMASQES